MEDKRKRGRPRKGEYYVRPDGARIVAFRVPPELNDELTMRAKRRGLTYQAYVQFALYDYMRREGLEDAELQAKIDATKTRHD